MGFGVTLRDIPLSHHWHTSNNEFLDELGVRLGRSAQDRATAAIIADIFVRSLSHPGAWTSYSRGAGWWSEKRRLVRTDYSLATVVNAIDTLDRLGWIEHQKSWRGRLGWQSRFRPNRKLLEFFAVQTPRVDYVPGSLIELRDENKRPKAFERTRFTDRMEDQLQRFNEAIRCLNIEVPGLVFRPNTPIANCGKAVINTADRNLRRIFNNGSWREGGRMYASAWQNVPKDIRPHMRLNGEPVCEPDHKNMHPQMLYAMIGRRIARNDDAYVVNDWPRELMKPAFNTMINARNFREGHGAVTRELAEHYGQNDTHVLGLVGDTESGDDWAKRVAWHELRRLFGAEARQLIEAIKRRHKPIEQFFFSGIGLKLQRHDSDMCAWVMNKLLKDGVATLPVQDSHIAPVRYKSHVESVMAHALELTLNRLGGKISNTSSGYLETIQHNGDPCGGVLLASGDVLLAMNQRGLTGLLSADVLSWPSRVSRQLDLFLGDQLPFSRLELLGEFSNWSGGPAPLSIRAAIVHEMRARGLTQDSVARQVGISRPQLTNVLRAVFGTSPKVAAKLKVFVIHPPERAA